MVRLFASFLLTSSKAANTFFLQSVSDSELAEKENDLFSSHSVDEATGQHKQKSEMRQKAGQHKAS